MVKNRIIYAQFKVIIDDTLFSKRITVKTSLSLKLFWILSFVMGAMNISNKSLNVIRIQSKIFETKK